MISLVCQPAGAAPGGGILQTLPGDCPHVGILALPCHECNRRTLKQNIKIISICPGRKGAGNLNGERVTAAPRMLHDRIVLKISGGSLGGNRLLEPQMFHAVAQMIMNVCSMGVRATVVLGGGNIFRGALSDEWGLSRLQADLVGVAATSVNALLLEGLLQDFGLPTAVYSRGSSIRIDACYQPKNVRASLRRGAVVLLAGGLGISGISTDVAAVDAAIDTAAPAVIMSKHGVDGIYTSDPRDPHHARRPHLFRPQGS
jgi:uridylate kinase